MAGSAQVYLLGTKHCDERCLGALFWRETDTRKCTDDWTSFKGIKFRSDEEVCMERLKGCYSDAGSDMECQDLDLCDSSCNSNIEGRNKGKRDTSKSATTRPKRRKSSCNSCDGTKDGHESTYTVESDGTGVIGDLHAIVIDDEEGLNRKIVPFIFQFFLMPCLIVLAIQNSSSLDLYETFVKELGFYAQLRREETSKLLVVYVPSQDPLRGNNTSDNFDDIVDSLQSKIFDSYFGGPFFSCQIDELGQKLPTLIHDIGKQPRATFKRQEIVNDSDSVIQNKSKKIEPENLVNKFLKTLRKMNLNIKCKFFDFFKNIPETELRKVYTDAFEKHGLIHREEDICYILPFILCEITASCNEKENKLEINDAVRLTVKSESVPAFLKVDILMTIQKEGWTIKSHGPNKRRSGDSYLFFLGRHGLVIEFCTVCTECEKLSYIYLDLLKLYEQCNCKIESKREYFETLRTKIEAALERFRDQLSTEKDVMGVTERRILDKLDKNNWIKEDLISDNQLHPWFTSKEKRIEEERNRELSDSFLADISELFGESYRLFFVSLGLPDNKVRIIEMENRLSTKTSIYELLREWRKHEGPGASIAKLRSAITNSSHLTVDINRFNDIVKDHGLN